MNNYSYYDTFRKAACFSTVIFCFLAVISCSGTRPKNLGVSEGRFNACPSTPNCVSSYADKSDEAHYIAPIEFDTSIGNARQRLLDVLRDFPRAEIIIAEKFYIYAEFSTLVFRFVDDVEFYIDGDENVIHVRSASRLGKSDLGVNRKRIDKIRKMFHEPKITPME
jgi:uncharacterized protein (DUF1499 family)